MKTKWNSAWKNLTKEIKLWEWIVLILAITLPLISFLYADTNSIIRCGVDVTKSMVSGNFLNYYDYTLLDCDRGVMMHPPTYDFLFYFIVGIWEIPMAIAELVTGKILAGSLLAMGYSKLFLLVFLLLAGWRVYKLGKEVGLSEKMSYWSAFMFMSSGFIFANLCIAGQYDIMGLFFTLIGVYYYAKKDMRKFVGWFAIAVQFKFFPLFIFIPLLLLAQKNLWKIAVNMVCVMLPTAIMRLPFISNLNSIAVKNEIQADMVDRIFRNRIAIFETEVPLSLLFLGAVCLYCYWKDVKEEEWKYYAVYIPFLALSALFLSFPFFPYWLTYLTPWMALLFFMKREKAERRFMFEMGMMVCVILADMSHFDWCYELNNTVGMLMDKIFPYAGFTNPLTLSNFNTILPIEEYEFFLYGMYIICLLAMIIVYYPKKEIQFQEESYPCRRMSWIHFVVSFGVGAVPFLLYLGSIARQIVFG